MSAAMPSRLLGLAVIAVVLLVLAGGLQSQRRGRVTIEDVPS